MANLKNVYFVKFCSQKSYADDLLAGKLYMRRLRYFRELEASEGHDDGRPDVNEGVACWWQPDDLEITITVPEIGEIKIGKDDLAGPVSFTFTFYEDLHLFCMCAVAIDMETEGQDEADFTAKVKAQLHVNERCLDFGRYAVVVQAQPFLSQIKQFLRQRGQWSRGGRVEYYDEEVFHGAFTHDQAPFRKQKRFSYQNEYRICVKTNTHGIDPLTIDVGDISGFATKIASAEVNAAFDEAKLELLPQPSTVGR